MDSGSTTPYERAKRRAKVRTAVVTSLWLLFTAFAYTVWALGAVWSAHVFTSGLGFDWRSVSALSFVYITAWTTLVSAGAFVEAIKLRHAQNIASQTIVNFTPEGNKFTDSQKEAIERILRNHTGGRA